MIDRNPERTREVARLRAEGMKLEEIARRVNLSISTVHAIVKVGQERERADRATALLLEALHLLNDAPRFKTRNRALDSYEVAARIDALIQGREDVAA